MDKIAPPLAEALAAATSPDQMFPVLVMCIGTTDTVIAALKTHGIEDADRIRELNIVTTTLSAAAIKDISLLDAVDHIELDAEASIN